MPLPMPIVVDPRFGYGLTSIVQSLQSSAAQAAMLKTTAQQGAVTDQWGNDVEVYGPNLAIYATIGADFNPDINGKTITGYPTGLPIAGVQVMPFPQATSSTAPTAGRAYQSALVRGVATMTKGTSTVTYTAIAPSSSSMPSAGQFIGAADVSDPSSGQATPAIVPGSKVASVSGSTVTLTPPAGFAHAVAESGTGIYCCACTWTLST